MDDLIKRQDAIDACLNGCCACVSDCVDEIEKLPSAQKTGKWIIFPPCIEEICMCSNCRTKFKKAYQGSDTCPSCGAMMEV